jgi:hypothetical protein
VSEDGSIVVGSSDNATFHEAFVWDSEFGMRPLKDVLENEFDVDTSLFLRLDYARTISPDGRVIGGRGRLQGISDQIGWMAVLPHPPGQFGCNIEMNAKRFANGATVQMTTLRYANLGPIPLGTRLRLSLELPVPVTIQVIDLGADGSFAIPAGLNVDLAPVNMFTVQPSQPRGAFALRCALEDPATGRVQAEDRVPFTLE